MTIDWNMVAAIAQALGFGGIIWGIAQNHRTLQTQVALEFYRRFADIAERMPDELRLPAHSATPLSSLAPDRRAAVMRSALAWFNLGSEEYGLYRSGRLGREVWAVTAREIDAHLARPIWREVWAEIRDGYASHALFQARIDEAVKASPTKPA